MVQKPTCQGSVLDLVLTNAWDLIPRVELVPGLSDHDIVHFDCTTRLPRVTNTAGPILLCDKANWDNMKEEMSLLFQLECLVANGVSVENQWQCFRTALQDSTQRHVLHQMPRGKASYPWITPEICKLLRKQDRKYQQLKKLGTEELRTEVKNLKREVQETLHQAYWDYVGKLFTPAEQEGDNPPCMKPFWS